MNFSTLMEAVYGFRAVVYHRTNNPLEIHSSGYRYGEGNTYGEGIYCTYELSSQMNDYMKEQYGEYLLKIAVDLRKFLILDVDMQEKLYGRRISIMDQFSGVGATVKKRNLTVKDKEEIYKLVGGGEELIRNARVVDDLFFGLSDVDPLKRLVSRVVYDRFRDYLNMSQYELTSHSMKEFEKLDGELGGEYSSGVAYKLSREIPVMRFDGMMFTGRQDGRVVVIYRFWDCATILGYAGPDMEWKKLNPAKVKVYR